MDRAHVLATDRNRQSLTFGRMSQGGAVIAAAGRVAASLDRQVVGPPGLTAAISGTTFAQGLREVDHRAVRRGRDRLGADRILRVVRLRRAVHRRGRVGRCRDRAATEARTTGAAASKPAARRSKLDPVLLRNSELRGGVPTFEPRLHFLLRHIHELLRADRWLSFSDEKLLELLGSESLDSSPSRTHAP